MCLILFSYRDNSQYPLVVAANRDERFDRPARLAQFWPDYPQLLAGQDLEANGTWLGITRNGRFAAITNFRGHAFSGNKPLSRGKLTRDFLLSTQTAKHCAETITEQAKRYQGFNLLLFDGAEFIYCHNNADSISSKSITLLSPGVYGLSNGVLDAPWPKIIRGKKIFKELLQNERIDTASTGRHKLTEQLLRLLHDDTLANDESLPNTGVSLTIERQLSPLFIRQHLASDANKRPTLEGYGTCNSTAIIVNKHQEVSFHERSFYQLPVQQNPIDQAYQFSIETV